MCNEAHFSLYDLKQSMQSLVDVFVLCEGNFLADLRKLLQKTTSSSSRSYDPKGLKAKTIKELSGSLFP